MAHALGSHSFPGKSRLIIRYFLPFAAIAIAMKKTRFLYAIVAASLVSACGSGASDAPSDAQISSAFESGDLGKTRRMIALAHAAGEINGQIQLVSAQVALARGDGIGAQTSLSAAKNAGIAEPVIWPLLAEAYARQGKHEEALAAAQKASGNRDRKTATLHVNGLKHWAADDPWEAREALEAAFALSPQNTRLALDLARARMELGLFPEAREAINQIRKTQPKNLLAPLALAEVDMRARRFPAARKAFAAALKIAPGNSEALLGQTRALYGEKKWKAAQDSVIALPREIGLRPEIQLLAGKIAARLNETKNARTHFSNARNLIDSDAEAQFLSGKVLLERGQPYKAIRLMEAALASRPDLPEYHAGLISAYRTAGDEAAARARLSKVPESLRGAKELQDL